MSTILEQDQINELIEVQTRISSLKNLADVCITKLHKIYEDTTGNYCHYILTDLDSIGQYIKHLEPKISTKSQYFNSFKMLRESYIRKTK